MQLIRGLGNIPSSFSGCVATIGNFDGVHAGHQTILRSLQQAAQAENLPTLVMLFEPQPKEFFAPDKAPARISNLREKLQTLSFYGVDYVLCLPFNQAFRSLTAEHFIEKVLVKALKVKHLIVGDDFQFGANRGGNFTTLEQAGEKFGFAVQDTNTVCQAHERVSSTRVREALAQGDLAAAKLLLKRPFAMSGRVGFGRQLGRTINTPTANIMVKRKHLPLTGVFAVKVENNDNGKLYRGVASIGVKPTVTEVPEPSLEVHLLDFDGNLYHQHLTVEFVEKIRDEQKFNGLEELKAAIEADKQKAKKILNGQ